jgi:accessory colonization factor AcfC
MTIKGLKDVIEIKNNSVFVKDGAGIRNMMDSLIYDTVFESDDEKRKALFILIKEIANVGVQPGSGLRSCI